MQGTSEQYETIIVGGGHGGAQLAKALRSQEYAGRIALISSELVPPYDRPTLTKGFLEGQVPVEDFLLCETDFWTDDRVDLLLETRVAAIEATRRVVVTVDGRELGYEHLVWAGGGTARKLPIPGSNLGGVHSLRSIDDANHLRADAKKVERAVIIGGGYVGLETAVALRKLGLAVTVVEVADKLLGRVTSPIVADYFVRRHQEAGVTFRLGVNVAEFTGRDGRVSGVQLSSGEVIPADLVVVGVGLIPSTEPLEAAGAQIGNGIEVNEYCQTSLPRVFAIGDCVSFPIPLYGGRMVRLESVQNAVDQAKIVADAILGNPRGYDPTPWFWSNQFEERLLTAGLLTGYDETVVRGSVDDGSFSVIYLRNSKILAIDAINKTKDFAQAKAALGTIYEGSRVELANPANSIRDALIATAIR